MELALAQSGSPDAGYWIALVSRILHILGAIILVGGIAYLCKVVAPAACNGEGDVAERLYSGRRKAWAMWVGIATVLLLVTGFYNYFLMGRLYPDLPKSYHMLFGIKFLLALGVFFLAAILAGKTALAERFRTHARKWLTLCLALSLVVLVVASVMRSLHLPAAPPAEEAVSAASES